MIVTCVTSRYLPNLRYIARLCEVDIAVLLDLASLPHRNRDSFVARNRIYQEATDEEHWLTIPVLRRGRTLRVREADVDPTDHRWARKHLRTLREAYPRAGVVAPGFLDALGDTLLSCTTSLLGTNFATLEVILNALGKEKHLPVFESTVVNTHRKEHRSDIAEALGANVYLAGEVERRSIREADLDISFATVGVALEEASAVPASLHLDAVRYSAVHLICTQGVAAARDTLARLMDRQTSP